MTTVLEIEKAIERLPPEEYGELRKWLEEYEADRAGLAAVSEAAWGKDWENTDEDKAWAALQELQ